MYICVTEIDAQTKILCTVEPQRTGPSLPEIKGLQIKWQDQSTWPIELNVNGTYLRAPKYYGICDNDADINVTGVLQVLTEEEYNTLQAAELEAKKPYPSWIGYLDTMTWGPPIPRPANAVMNGGNVYYQWDEAILNWIPKVN